MRLLLLHTDEAIRSLMPNFLRLWLAKSPQTSACEVVVEDANKLDYPRAVSLLKEEFEYIILNLRLPAMLSVRIAELVHLGKVPSRLILMSGAPEDLGPGLSLYDGYIRIPFLENSLEASLDEALGRPFLAENRPMTSQEHLDIAILNLLQKYDALVPGCRSALHAFGIYRDAYLHRPSIATADKPLLPKVTLSQRLNFFAEVRPLSFSKRVCEVMECVNQSSFYLPKQKRFLWHQFNYLLDVIGLTLINFRTETEEILQGLEQFARVGQAVGTDINPASMRELLLARSEGMRYVHQGILQIVGLLPGSG
jgi:hypothetical protein